MANKEYVRRVKITLKRAWKQERKGKKSEREEDKDKKRVDKSGKSKNGDENEVRQNEYARSVNIKVKRGSRRGKEGEDAIANMDNGTIVMFENTRFEDVKDGEVVKYESKNDPSLGAY